MPASASALDVSAVQSYASLSRRVTAYLRDLVIMLCVLMLVSITLRILNAFGLWTSLGGATGGNPVHLWHSLGIGSKLFVVSSFVLLMGPVYKILFEASPWQATFGKRLLKIDVTDNAGRRITLARSCGRWFAMWIFGWFGGSFVSLILIPLTKSRKALHDMAAGTLVLTGRPQDGQLEPWRVLLAFGFP